MAILTDIFSQPLIRSMREGPATGRLTESMLANRAEKCWSIMELKSLPYLQRMSMMALRVVTKQQSQQRNPKSLSTARRIISPTNKEYSHIIYRDTRAMRVSSPRQIIREKDLASTDHVRRRSIPSKVIVRYQRKYSKPPLQYRLLSIVQTSPCSDYRGNFHRSYQVIKCRNNLQASSRDQSRMPKTSQLSAISPFMAPPLSRLLEHCAQDRAVRRSERANNRGSTSSLRGKLRISPRLQPSSLQR